MPEKLTNEQTMKDFIERYHVQSQFAAVNLAIERARQRINGGEIFDDNPIVEIIHELLPQEVK